MKTIFTFLLLALFTLGLNAQLLKPILFEGDTTGNASWTLFGNGTQEDVDVPDLKIVLNPAKSEVNNSDSVMMVKVNVDAVNWVGLWSDAYGEMEFTDASHTLYVTVHKSNIAPIAFKLENSTNGGATVMEIKAENTVADEWELVGVEMTPAIGFTYTRLVFFPDFPDARTDFSGSMNYFDNFYNSEVVSVRKVSDASKLILYPNPAENIMSVQFPKMSGYTISNLLGQSLKTSRFQTVSNKAIEVSELKTGVYFITIESESGMFTSKFMKK